MLTRGDVLEPFEQCSQPLAPLMSLGIVLNVFFLVDDRHRRGITRLDPFEQGADLFFSYRAHMWPLSRPGSGRLFAKPGHLILDAGEALFEEPGEAPSQRGNQSHQRSLSANTAHTSSAVAFTLTVVVIRIGAESTKSVSCGVSVGMAYGRS